MYYHAVSVTNSLRWYKEKEGWQRSAKPHPPLCFTPSLLLVDITSFLPLSFSLCLLNIIIHQWTQETQTLIGLQGQRKCICPLTRTHAHTHTLTHKRAQTKRAGKRTCFLCVADTMNTCYCCCWIGDWSNFQLINFQPTYSTPLIQSGYKQKEENTEWCELWFFLSLLFILSQLSLCSPLGY